MGGAAEKRPLPAACVHIVVDLGRVVVVHGGGRVEQHGQQVLLHVADLGGVVVQALHDELDVGAVQLQKPRPNDLVGKVRPGDPGGLAPGADRFHDQLHDLVQVLPVGGKLPAQVVVLDVLQHQIPILLHFLHRHRIPSFPFRRPGRRKFPEGNGIGTGYIRCLFLGL